MYLFDYFLTVIVCGLVCTERIQMLKVDLITNVLDPEQQQLIEEAEEQCKRAQQQLTHVDLPEPQNTADSQ